MWYTYNKDNPTYERRHIMNCPICGAFIEDENAKVCPNCGENLKIAFQRQKVNEAAAANVRLLNNTFKSGRFLACAIMLSVVCGLYALAFFYSITYDGIISAGISYALYLVFGIFTLVGMWKLYSNKSDGINKKDVEYLGYFPRLMQIITMVLFVCMIVVTVIVVIALAAAAVAINISNNISINELIAELEREGIVSVSFDIDKELIYKLYDIFVNFAYLIVVVISVVLVAYTVFCLFASKAYKNIKLYADSLASLTVTGMYMPPAKFSSKLIFVMGILQLVLSAPGLLGNSIEQLPSVALGVYLILISRIFKDLDAGLSLNNMKLENERRILDSMIFEEKNNNA